MDKPDILLDSDVMIEILRNNPKAIQWLLTQRGKAIGLPVIVRMELVRGARNRQEQRTIVRELDKYETVHLETGDTIKALKWFEDFYLSHGLGIMDCLIAAPAVRLRRPLYTFNVRHYRVIPGLDA
ncbi:MAG: VapC toxin family PIN domain ribonuclease [Chloroflexi bacterium]|nr:MAG: VapC toxin family PIN domain ribonuclease [Chloroflexota bacterium]